MARRSVLFSPGDQPDLLGKAPDSGADVVVFDLEDAVAPGAKAAARETVKDALAAVSTDCEVWVRVTPTGVAAAEDLDAVLAGAGRPNGVVLPKVAGAEDVQTLADILAEHDAGDLAVAALLETAAGVLAAEAVAAAPATDALVFGAEDLAADLGAARTPEGTEVLHARQRVVLAAAAAGIDAIDTLVTDYEDADRLRADARRSVTWGFDGKLAIHPAQVPLINDAFTPDADRIEWAERVVAAREEAAAADRGVFSVDGEMIDAPLLAQAERILERAAAADER